jgi:hypothetical protein
MSRANRFVAWMMFASLAACASTAPSPAQSPAQSAAQDNGGDADAKAVLAEQRARLALARELKLEFDEVEIVSAEPQTWPDSSLGCPKPGEMAAQVITFGYAMIFKSPRGNYRVHATDNYAVVCGPATQWRNGVVPRANVPLRNINLQIDHARADLSRKLGAAESDIKTVGFVAAEWIDSSMDCPVQSEEALKQATKGYRITLEYRSRAYTYHTDLSRVRACPSIELN